MAAVQQTAKHCIIGSVSDPTEAERDRALVLKAQKSPEAFGLIFDIYYSKILSYALRRVGDAEAAQDIAAETFAKAFLHINRFTWRGIPFSAWLYRIVGNEVKMFYRRPKRTVSLEVLREDGFDAASELKEERELLQELVLRDAQFKKVMIALRALPLRQGEAIVLRYIEEKEMQEIAAILGCREGTVRSLISRGMSGLRSVLSVSMQQTTHKGITDSEARGVLSALK